MSFETYLALAGALLVFSAAPGPCVIALTARSLSAPLPSAMLMASGMMLGDLVYASAALLGVAAVGQALGEFCYVIRIAGAVYLIVLGVRAWIHRPEAVRDIPPPSRTRGSRDLASGLMLCLGNPKVILFYAGFLPAFIDLTLLEPLDGLGVLATVALVVGGVLLANAVLASRVRRWFTSRRSMRILHRGSGTVMIGAGLALIAKE
ncbi:MAG: LysE family translocator [Deltaproteobacteria bacterium]|nr:LysE family translocator [Deltaproteobacteria bacterium]